MFTRRKSQREKSTKKPYDDATGFIDSVDDRKRRKSNGVTTCIVCPVCTVTVRGDLKFHQHYTQELDKVKEPFSSVDAKRRHYQTRLKYRKQCLNNSVEDDECDEKVKSLEERSKDLDTIRKKRYERYADMFLISMKRKNTNHRTDNTNNSCNTNNILTNTSTIRENNTSSQYELVTCAVCNEFLETTNCNRHLSKCFAKHDYQFELFSSSEDEDEAEEEEEVVQHSGWMDNAYFRREGNLTRLVMEDADDDVELDIDGDDESQEFGRQQYLFFQLFGFVIF